MKTTLLTEILALLLGRKYYANIIYTRGIDKQEMSSFIFYSKADAMEHKARLDTNKSFGYLTTISFRSRKDLTVTTYAKSQTSTT